MKNIDIFISYSRKDYDQIIALKEELESHIPGLTCWHDISGIETGTELVENIIDAIDHAKFIIFAISENSLVSEWTKKEVLYANSKGIPIFPVMLNDTTIEVLKANSWFHFMFGSKNLIFLNDDIQKSKLFVDIAKKTNKTYAGNQEKTTSHKIDLPTVFLGTSWQSNSNIRNFLTICIEGVVFAYFCCILVFYIFIFKSPLLKNLALLSLFTSLTSLGAIYLYLHNKRIVGSVIFCLTVLLQFLIAEAVNDNSLAISLLTHLIS